MRVFTIISFGLVLLTIGILSSCAKRQYFSLDLDELTYDDYYYPADTLDQFVVVSKLSLDRSSIDSDSIHLHGKLSAYQYKMNEKVNSKVQINNIRIINLDQDTLKTDAKENMIKDGDPSKSKITRHNYQFDIPIPVRDTNHLRYEYDVSLHDLKKDNVKNLHSTTHPLQKRDNVFLTDIEYINPFCPMTTIQYFVPDSGEVQIMIYNVKGNKVDSCYAKHDRPGAYSIEPDMSNLAAGIYFYKIILNGEALATRKFVYLR